MASATDVSLKLWGALDHAITACMCVRVTVMCIGWQAGASKAADARAGGDVASQDLTEFVRTPLPCLPTHASGLTNPTICVSLPIRCKAC